MKITAIITATLITVFAATSFATTKCDHKYTGAGISANTHPPAVVTHTVKTANVGTQSGTR